MQALGSDPINQAQWRALDAIGQRWSAPHEDDWLLAIDDTCLLYTSDAADE